RVAWSDGLGPTTGRCSAGDPRIAAPLPRSRPQGPPARYRRSEDRDQSRIPAGRARGRGLEIEVALRLDRGRGVRVRARGTGDASLPRDAVRTSTPPVSDQSAEGRPGTIQVVPGWQIPGI